MSATALLLGLPAAISGLYWLRGRQINSSGRNVGRDTPATELVERLEAMIGPVDRSVMTMPDGTQIVELPHKDPVNCALALDDLDLPATAIVADLDGMVVRMWPHPEMRDGTSTVALVEGGVAEVLRGGPQL